MKDGKTFHQGCVNCATCFSGVHWNALRCVQFVFIVCICKYNYVGSKSGESLVIETSTMIKPRFWVSHANIFCKLSPSLENYCDECFYSVERCVEGGIWEEGDMRGLAAENQLHYTWPAMMKIFACKDNLSRLPLLLLLLL